MVGVAWAIAVPLCLRGIRLVAPATRIPFYSIAICGVVLSAIGYFPNNWNAEVGREIARTNQEITTLVPALVEPNIAASASLGSYVKVGAREHNGAVYVIAVNATNPVQCTPETRCSHTHGPGCGHEAVCVTAAG